MPIGERHFVCLVKKHGKECGHVEKRGRDIAQHLLDEHNNSLHPSLREILKNSIHVNRHNYQFLVDWRMCKREARFTGYSDGY